jgi:Fe-S oxidoreductase
MTYPTLKSILVLVALATALGVFGWRIYKRLWVNLRQGRPSGPFGDWGKRIEGLFVYVAGQLKLFRVRLPGIAHFFIFWGFMVLSLTILQAIVEGLLSFVNPHFVLPIVGSFGPLVLLQDLFVVFVVIAVAYDIVVRIAVKPKRYEGSHGGQAVLVLGFIMAIMLSLSVMNGIYINLGELPAATWRPVSRLVGSLFSGLTASTQMVIAEAAYWVHLGVVLIFLTELPEGKHFHVVTSIPAILLRDLEPAGRLKPAPEMDGQVGVGSIEEFRWREMLDFFTCTECGRCQDACPAFASSGLLSPKLLMMNLRDALKARAAAAASRALLGDVLPDQVLWSCTTCQACDQECPLTIKRVGMIVDMRRRLVVDGRLDTELQDALANLGRYGNSFGQSERARARWTQPLETKIKDARREPVEYLWFVGDYASYSPASIETTLKTARVLQQAGIDFGILYEGERNSGNDARRVGEEGLFEMLSEQNTGSISKCSFKTLVTTDPHSYNTLKNEYRWNGNGRPAVMHMAELLDELISSGELRLTKTLGRHVTYHDPCYLGRYNDIYDAPRRVIQATGCKLEEMPRHGDRAACCGAGGGRIWMKEGDVKERPGEARVREAAAVSGVQALVVACPKDVSMFRDAVKTTGNEEQLEVQDLADLVYEAM